MARLIVLINSVLLLLFGSDVFLVGASFCSHFPTSTFAAYQAVTEDNKVIKGKEKNSRILSALYELEVKHETPASCPVNVSVMHLRADSATVSWEVPEGDIIIGFSISQQKQDGHMQRFIREVNTTSRSCVLWDLEEETDYIIQVQSIGLYGESQASKKIHFRTLKKTDRFSSNSSNQGVPKLDPCNDMPVFDNSTSWSLLLDMDSASSKEPNKISNGLDMSRHLQTGEMIIIVVVLVMWAAVIALFCRQYDIIKDNDSSNNKEKVKPLSERSTPEHHSGGLLRSKFHPSVPSINIIEV